MASGSRIGLWRRLAAGRRAGHVQAVEEISHAMLWLGGGGSSGRLEVTVRRQSGVLVIGCWKQECKIWVSRGGTAVGLDERERNSDDCFTGEEGKAVDGRSNGIWEGVTGIGGARLFHGRGRRSWTGCCSAGDCMEKVAAIRGLGSQTAGKPAGCQEGRWRWTSGKINHNRGEGYSRSTTLTLKVEVDCGWS